MFDGFFNDRNILKEKRHVILLCMIIIVALTVRLYGISAENMWLDEAFSVYHAQQSLDHIITLDDPHPPLYLILLHFFTQAFGTGELGARLPSVIFGVLSVIMIYFLGSRMFGKRTGLYASLILALSTYHVFYSQEARAYELLGLLSLVSTYFFINYVSLPRNKEAALYVISTALLLYSHFFAVFIFVAQNIYYLLLVSTRKDYGKLKKWLAVQFLIILAYLPGLLNLYSGMLKISEDFWISGETLGHFFYVSYLFSGGVVLSIVYPLLFLYAIYHFASPYFIKKRGPPTKNEKWNFLLALMLMFVPIIIPLAYSFLASPILLMRYVISSSLMAYIIVAFSLSKIKQRYQIIILLVLLVSSFYNIAVQAADIEKEPWGNISSYVSSVSKQNSVIVLEPGYIIMPLLYYHDPSCFAETDIYGCASEKKVYTIWGDHQKEIKYIDYAPSVIYISRFPENTKSGFLEMLESNYEIESSKKFTSVKGGNVTVSFFIT